MGSFQRILEKYHIDKWFQKENLVVMILAGILLVVIALPTNEDREEENVLTMYGSADIGEIQHGQAEKTLETYKDNGEDTETETDDYITSLEKKLADILSKIKGAGEVHVMITLQESEELIVEKDKAAESEETVYESEGGMSIPYVIKTVYPKVEGVVVVAEGAGTGKVTQHITEAVQALFSIEIHKIKVMGR